MRLSLYELTAVYKHIVQASTPRDVFGAFDTSTTLAKDVQGVYRRLARTIHPDMYTDDTQAYHMANEAMRELAVWYKQALEEIKNNQYGKKPYSGRGLSHSYTEYTVGSNTYRVEDDVIEGDFCHIRLAELWKKVGDKEDVVLKFPIDAADSDLLANEATILQSIAHKSLPLFLDTFKWSDGRRVNVLRFIRGYDLVELRKRFPNGLPQEHTVWVCDRLLGVLGFLHSHGIIHSAIEPGNIMITPENHNGYLLDYVVAIPEATKIGAKYKATNSYTAPEVLKNPKIAPHPSADMYSLGLSMLYLLGGDIASQTFPKVDYRIKTFFQEFLIPDPNKRVYDAWNMWTKLREVRRAVFGAETQFLHLEIP